MVNEKENMKVMISGDSSGLGYELCKTLHKDYDVVGFSRKKRVVMDMLGHWRHFEFDLNNYKDVPDLICDELSSTDILIHNAAISSNNLVVVEPNSVYEQLMKINVLAPVHLTKLWIKCRLLQQKYGHVLFVSSICTKKHFKGLSAYSMTKSAINSFSKTIATEMSSKGIRSNSILPGYMKTNMTEELSDEQLNKIKNRTPMKRLVDIKEVCDTIHFVISGGTFLNGSEIIIDGGFTI